MLFSRNRSYKYWSFVIGNILFACLAIVCVGLVILLIVSFVTRGIFVPSESLVIASVALITLVIIRWYYLGNLYLVNSIENRGGEFIVVSFFGTITCFKKVSNLEFFDKYIGGARGGLNHKCMRVTHEKGTTLVFDIDEFESQKELIAALKVNLKKS